MKIRTLLSVLLISSALQGWSQYAPPAGQPGTTAMAGDSSIFIAWAISCTVEAGPVNISQASLGLASYGVENDACGTPDNLVISLGDGGQALLSFERPITNGEGFDFAVFENSLSDEFLELCFVEVSSDGQHFVRFPAVSLTQTETQVATFGSIDATKIHNFGGKYRALFGTPFDLEDLADSSNIDLNHIVAIRLIDVLGSINPLYASYDSQGNIVNDPWPTAFASCGFDLDAVGVIHQSYTNNVNKELLTPEIKVFPQPSSGLLNIQVPDSKELRCIELLSGEGNLIRRFDGQVKKINTGSFTDGFYLLRFFFRNDVVTKKILIQSR